MPANNIINSLVGLRLAVGAASWAAPRLSGKAFGLDANANPQLPYVARLFGARDVALAYGALTTQGDARRQWLAIGAACDVADAFAGVAAGRRGYLPKFTAALVTTIAISAAALGAAALSDTDD